MEIQSQNPKMSGNLFHAIGKFWKEWIIIKYLKSKQNVGSIITDGLIPFLEYKDGDGVDELFNPEVVLGNELVLG